MKSLYKTVLIVIFCSVSLSLPGVRLRYRVSSMKLNVADIEMVLKEPYINISVKSRIKVPLFPYLNNRYEIIHDEQYRPLHYTRIVNQTEITDSVYTEYNRGIARMHIKSTGQSTSYNVRNDTRDIFSLLAKISSDPNAGGTYYVDGNGGMWKVVISKADTERINTALGRQTARRHSFTFEPLSSQKAPYIDMLTFNFLDPDNNLTLWVSMNDVPLKAHLKKKMMSMSWDILSVSQ